MDVTIAVVDETKIQVSSSDGVVLSLTGDCGDPCPVQTGSNGKPYLIMEDTGQVRVFGEGFQPGSTAHVWIFSTQTYLGPAPVNGSGVFDRSFQVTVAPGEHTVQVNGITNSRANRSANLGLVVNAGSGSGQLPNTGASMSLAYLGLGLLAAGTTTIGITRAMRATATIRRDAAI